LSHPATRTLVRCPYAGFVILFGNLDKLEICRGIAGASGVR